VLSAVSAVCFSSVVRLCASAVYVPVKLHIPAELHRQRTEEEKRMRELFPNKIFSDVGDITAYHTDAVVNAANSTLMGGGGVDGAIHRAGGPEILEACRELRRNQYPDGLPAGGAAASTAGRLPARWVIHTVGPVWHGGKQNEEQTLRKAYRNSLYAADELGCSTIAFPAISTGVYRFPKEIAAKAAWQTVREFMLNESEHLQQVYFVFFSRKDEEIFVQAVQES